MRRKKKRKGLKYVNRRMNEKKCDGESSFNSKRKFFLTKTKRESLVKTCSEM